MNTVRGTSGDNYKSISLDDPPDAVIDDAIVNLDYLCGVVSGGYSNR